MQIFYQGKYVDLRWQVPYEHIETRQAHVGSFYPAILHALHIKHLVEDVSTKPLDYILRCSPKQTIISSLSRNKLSHPISVEHSDLHTNQVLPRDIFEPTMHKMTSINNFY